MKNIDKTLELLHLFFISKNENVSFSDVYCDEKFSRENNFDPSDVLYAKIQITPINYENNPESYDCAIYLKDGHLKLFKVDGFNLIEVEDFYEDWQKFLTEKSVSISKFSENRISRLQHLIDKIKVRGEDYLEVVGKLISKGNSSDKQKQ